MNRINLNPFGILLILILTVLSFTASAQSVPGAISGKVIGNDQKPIESAVIRLFKLSDSTLISNAVSIKDGTFTIKSPAAGSYRLTVSFIGFKPFQKLFSLAKEKATANLGTLILEEGIELNAVKIEGEGPAIKVKEDTTEFNAAAFKTVPGAAAEELIKKLPGMEVDKDGNIKAQGESVKKVLVEGKEFFGNDPKIATKNLPADAIKSIQLIEDKSEQAKSTGIDDGKREKILNIVLKDDKKKGWFGNSSLAGGTQDRYLGSLSLNHFDKKTQVNALLLGNNINQAGFSPEEATNFGGSGGTSYTVSNGSLVARTMNGVNIGNASQGLATTYSGGLNFSKSWLKKDAIKFSGSYFAYSSATIVESQNNSQNIIPAKENSQAEIIQQAQTIFGEGINTSRANSQSHRFNMRLTARIDSLTNLTFSPSISLGSNSSNRLNRSAQTNSDADSINYQRNISRDKSVSPFFQGSLSLNRNFKQKKGSISFYISGNSRDNSSENIDSVFNKYHKRNTEENYYRMEDNERINHYLSISNTINRTVSKDKKTSIFVTNNYNSTINNTDLSSFEYNPDNGRFELRIDSLTNTSKSKTLRYGPELGFSKSLKKVNIYFRTEFQFMTLNGEVLSKNLFQTVSKNYFNALPYLSVTYRPKANRSLSVTTYSNSYAPSVRDLQAVQNNTSQFYIRRGNPDLKATTSYSTSLRYSSSQPKKNSYTNFSLSYTRTFNDVSHSTNTDASAVTISQPINVDGNYRFSLNGSISIPSKIKGLRISPGIHGQNSRNQNFAQGKANNSDRYIGGGNLTLSYAHKDILNITLNNRTSFTHIDNSAQRTVTNNYFNIDNSGSISIQPVKKWRINTDGVYRSNAGRSFTLLNASLQKQFMKSNRLAAELCAFDILNNNSDISRYAYDLYISDTRTNNINQYFYLKLLYKVNKIGGSASRVASPPVILDYY
ncbi:MAG: outer membrane beta-barrel protein [Sphingobacteriaceae bacterium]|nr:outer membrane beta-barrel protein [Sphingobacteriaceae bacterium]